MIRRDGWQAKIIVGVFVAMLAAQVAGCSDDAEPTASTKTTQATTTTAATTTPVRIKSTGEEMSEFAAQRSGIRIRSDFAEAFAGNVCKDLRAGDDLSEVITTAEIALLISDEPSRYSQYEIAELVGYSQGFFCPETIKG